MPRLLLIPIPSDSLGLRANKRISDILSHLDDDADAPEGPQTARNKCDTSLSAAASAFP